MAVNEHIDIGFSELILPNSGNIVRAEIVQGRFKRPDGQPDRKLLIDGRAPTWDELVLGAIFYSKFEWQRARFKLYFDHCVKHGWVAKKTYEDAWAGQKVRP